MAKAAELKVFITRRASTCDECGQQIGRSAWIALAGEKGLASIAFPGISTGVYGYPVEQAARVAVTAVASFLARSETSLRDVRFVLFGEDALPAWTQALAAV